MDEVLRQLIEKVSLGTDIVAVIGEHVPLDQHHRGKCPFHQDNNPSFSVNNEGQYFHCFGCGASGDAIDFIQRIQSISFMAALRALAQRAAVPFPELNNNGWDRFEDERRTEDILTETAHYYHKTLTPEAKNYLINARGFREDTIVRFRLGYARGGLANYLTVDRGFPLDQCVKAGVLRQKEDGTVRDFFYER